MMDAPPQSVSVPTPPDRGVSPSQQIFPEQVKLLYRMLPRGLAASAAVATLLAIVFWNVVDQFTLTLWLTVMAAILLARFLSAVGYRNSHPGPDSSELWARRFMIGSTCTGIGWGAFGVAMFPQDPLYQVLLTFVLGGMAIGAVPTLSPIRKVYLAYLIPVMIPVTLKILSQGDSFHLTIGLFLIIFIAILTVTCYDIHRTITDHLATKLENVAIETVNLKLKTEIAERERVEESVRHLAYHDALTGLPNRMLLQDRINRAITHMQRSNRQAGILFIDLDRFKTINDTLGHGIGDRLLQAVTRRLLECLREEDTVARSGGDEFVIVLPELENVENAGYVANHVLQSLARPIIVDDHVFHITSSIGVSIYPNDGKDAESLLQNADVAMYAAKNAGRNNYRFFSPDMNARARENLSLEQSLRHALERGELMLYYQPQMNLGTGRVTAVEALLRWQSPQMGLVLPDNFIPIAEETGLIIPIGEWVLKNACMQVKKWQDAGHPTLRAAVNISVRQFKHQNFASTILRVLEEASLEPQYLDLEITESLLMKNTTQITGLLQEMHGMGVQITVDDFGAGYSNLGYFKHFPVDRLKVDKSLIRDIDASASSDAAIAAAIIAMGHSLDLDVIAEGVETQDQLGYLRSLWCDEVQGYLLSHPLDVEECNQFLSRA